MAAMMNTAYKQHQLPANFTFRIIEMLKRIKIHAMPRSTGLPWGLSLAAGIAVVVMTLGSQMAIRQLSEPLVFSREMTVPEVREIAVDILRAPGTSILAGKQGDTYGVGIDQRGSQDTSLLAPARGGGTWTQKADMPTARYVTGSAVVNGKIYVIGGAPVRCGITTVVEEYDPATDTWTTRADMPTARQGVAVAAVDGIIYAIGGWEGNIATCLGNMLSTVEAYDPAKDRWTRKADMPTPRTLSAIAVVDGIIYVIGGWNDPWVLSTVEAYDPAADRWTRKADMPTARYQLAACAIDGRIYVSGGGTKPSRIAPDFAPVPTVEVYDPAADTWTQASDMPRTRLLHTASAVAGKMYIIGGVDFVGGVLPFSVDVYNPARDAWTAAGDRLPTTRCGLTAAVVDGKIYTIGGFTGPGTPTLSIVEEYDLGLSQDRSNIDHAIKPEGKVLTTWGEVRSAE